MIEYCHLPCNDNFNENEYASVPIIALSKINNKSWFDHTIFAGLWKCYIYINVKKLSSHEVMQKFT